MYRRGRRAAVNMAGSASRPARHRDFSEILGKSWCCDQQDREAIAAILRPSARIMSTSGDPKIGGSISHSPFNIARTDALYRTPALVNCCLDGSKGGKDSKRCGGLHIVEV